MQKSKDNPTYDMNLKINNEMNNEQWIMWHKFKVENPSIYL